MSVGPGNFRTIRRFLTARHFTAGEGGLLGLALDHVREGFVRRLYLGMLARFPEAAPDDALALIGKDRRVIRGIDETNASYTVRLLAWLTDRRTAGSPWALMKKLQEYIGGGSSFRTVDARGNWFSRSAAGVETYTLNTLNWNWDSSVPSTEWSRFWVIIYPGTRFTTTGQLWDDGSVWDDTTKLWDLTGTADQHQTIRFLVADWKPAGTKCDTIIYATDPASFNPASPEPDGKWGKWFKVVGGVIVPSRLSTAYYADGV